MVRLLQPHLDCAFWESLLGFLCPLCGCETGRDHCPCWWVGPSWPSSAEAILIPFYTGPEFKSAPSCLLCSPKRNLLLGRWVLSSHRISELKDMWQVRHWTYWETSGPGAGGIPLEGASNLLRTSNLDPGGCPLGELPNRIEKGNEKI